MFPLVLLPLGLALADGPPRPVADAPGTVIPVRSWDVEHLHLDLRVDVDAREVVGTATHRLAPLARPASTLRLHQVGLDISEVRVDGAPVDGWRVGADFIEIPVTPGVPHEVAVDWRARPETGLHFRGERGGPDAVREVWSQGEDTDNRHWFPGWDHPSDRFTLSVDLTVAPGLSAYANGVLVAKEPASDPAPAGWTTWRYRLDHELVTYLVAIGVGEYAEHELPGARVPMSVIAPRTMTPKSATQGFDKVVGMLPFFDDLLGTPYPYPNYRQLVVQRFLYGGMENTTLTILAQDLAVQHAWQTDDRAESVAAHELAHQWFGDLLTCYGWRELWLNEGFATYYTNRWMEVSRGEAYAAVRRRGMFDAALAQKRPMASRSWSPNNERPNAGVYVRGASVLYMLEKHLGREAYDAGIRTYVARNVDRLVETDDLRRALEDVSGEHLGWLFDGWVHGAGAPSFEVRHRFSPPEGDSEGRVAVQIDQTTKDGVWHAPVTVEIGTATGVVTRRIWLGPARATVELETSEPPRWVLVDPERAVVAHWKQHQSTEQWIAAATDSPTWDGRLTALHALGDGPSRPNVIQTLAAVLADDGLDEGVHRLAAQSLGRLKTPEAAAVLLPLLDAPAWHLRAAAADGLRPFADDDQVGRALAKVAREDAHAQVAASALGSLSSVDPERTRAEARRRTRQRYDPELGPVATRALQVLGAHGDLSDLGLILSRASLNLPRGVTAAALEASALILQRNAEESGIDRAKARFTAAAIPALSSPDLRLRQSAVFALSRGGDAGAIRALGALASTTRLESLRDAALDAASAIRRAGAPKSDKPANEDLQRLRDRLDAAEKRLETLEVWR